MRTLPIIVSVITLKRTTLREETAVNNDIQSAANFILSDQFNDETKQKQPEMPGDRDVRATMQIVPPQSVNERFLALRANNPYVTIVQFPSYVISGLLAFGAAVDVAIPSGAQYCAITSTGGLWVSRSNALVDNVLGSGRFYIPPSLQELNYFVGGMQQFNIATPSASGTQYAVSFYIQQ
jgi:hypothetical protein